jgi:hypothetical protein
MDGWMDGWYEWLVRMEDGMNKNNNVLLGLPWYPFKGCRVEESKKIIAL